MESKFDLEAAKAGKPVETRSGFPVRILCYDALGKRPIIALVKTSMYAEVVEEYYLDGRSISKNVSSVLDLVMVSRES